MSNNGKLFAGYIPVLHDGYIKAINRHPDAVIGIFNSEILDDLSYLHKDIRALNPKDIKKAIEGLGREAIIMGRTDLKKALQHPIIMPSDDITRSIVASNPDAIISLEPIFLRWDRNNSIEQSVIVPDKVVRPNKKSPIIKALNSEHLHSTNWWRHVAAIIHNDKEKIYFSGHNSSLPTEYSSLIVSDPRITAKKGESIERSIDIHAEARIIAEAAKKGIALNGLSISISTFPCPNCAKLIALSGIKTCYYIDGYAMIDGYSILKDYGVEVVKLDTTLDKDDPKSLKPYKIS